MTQLTYMKKKIKYKPPNSSHRQLAEIAEVLNSTIARVIQQRQEVRSEWPLRHGQQEYSPKQKHEGKDPNVEEAISVVTGQGVRVSGQMLKSESVELARRLVITISKQHMVGCLSGNADLG